MVGRPSEGTHLFTPRTADQPGTLESGLNAAVWAVHCQSPKDPRGIYQSSQSQAIRPAVSRGKLDRGTGVSQWGHLGKYL